MRGRTLLYSSLIMTMTLTAGAPAHAQKIRMIVEGQVIAATLTDNPTTRDLLFMLPLTLTLTLTLATTPTPRKSSTWTASCRPPARRPAARRRPTPSPTTPRGATWRSSTRTSRTRADGQVRVGARSAPLGRAADGGEIVVEDSMEYGDLDKKFQQSTFGAHFVEAVSYTHLTLPTKRIV